MKKYLRMSPAAVVIGALRVNFENKEILSVLEQKCLTALKLCLKWSFEADIIIKLT